MANHDSNVHVRKAVGGAIHTSSECLSDNSAAAPTQRLINNSEDNGEAVAKCELERAKSRFMTIELPVTLACFSYRLLVTLEAEYIHARVAADYNFSLTPNASQSTCNGNGNVNGSSGNMVNEEVQSVTSLWLLYLGLAMFVPNLFTALWFGFMGDRAGRKPALFVPVLGFWCQSIVYFAIVRFQLSLYVFFAGDFISGFCGSTALTQSTAAAYITDVTSVKSRTFRVVVLETVAFVGSALGQISLGLLLQFGGRGEGGEQYNVFLTPLILAFATSSASLIYIIFPRVLIETVDRRTATGRSLMSGVVNMFRVNINMRRYKLVLYMAVMVCVAVASASLSNLIVIYSMGAPFCFTPLFVSFLQVTLYIVSAIGMIVGGAVLPRLLSENWVLQLSIWNILLVYVIVGFARDQTGLFVGVAVSILCALCFPLVRSQLSKLAEPNERGLMLATSGCMNSAAYIITPLMSQYVYLATVFFYPPFVFFFQAAFLLLPSLATGNKALRLQFEPELENEVENEGAVGGEDENEPEDIERRLGNRDWCSCSGGCVAMPTVKESVCCKEIARVVAKMDSFAGDDLDCITMHLGFKTIFAWMNMYYT
ncbi:proton-coupled folate transporter-like [Diadema setosum]|uniref:proton-coupled folate transporter-like n=1 Tax=Diadema setosum TaxID=31175 RepID=UPI003B3ABB60